MPFIEEGVYDWPVEEEIVDTISVILTRSDEDDSCCMVVSCKLDDYYEPDYDWYDNLDEDLWILYQYVDIQWAYRDSSMEQPNRVSKTATVLLPR